MLAYQHAYHAGNFADVHKHLALYCLARALTQKASPISFIDTHAGRGCYPLDAVETQKLGEYRQGIERLWRQRDDEGLDSTVDDWLAQISTLQTGERLSHYPGSPWWLGEAMREQDRLTLFELHPGEHRLLAEQTLPTGRRAQYRHADGLQGLIKLLPVSTPRLCVLIDPSYERKAEYDEVAQTLLQTVRKVRHAVIQVWYPLLPAQRHLAMLENLRAAGIPKLWRSELTVRAPESEHGMYGSGVLILNPPWQLDETLARAFATLAPTLGDTASHCSEWWTGEA